MKHPSVPRRAQSEGTGVIRFCIWTLEVDALMESSRKIDFLSGRVQEGSHAFAGTL